ncbi:hypothetical protein GIB67_036351 [Kingdonia uniflora]|uniref:Uncharacterized protein n=1 Tax=Kingdonia uniflora TaxID=39325 RepID=A0A7J7L432_9MAGN|nr:hypothetical protein GIB67_036351 [Kingdonia uniflora]
MNDFTTNWSKTLEKLSGRSSETKLSFERNMALGQNSSEHVNLFERYSKSFERHSKSFERL